MERDAVHVEPVAPVAGDGPRPRWSVMIPSYNCSRFLAATIEAVLAQDPGPDAMQIEVVDDASGDDPGSVVRTVGKGRVGFYRQERNVGHIGNFQTCLARAKGEIVHLLHGDDLVRPDFYEAMGRGLEAAPQAGAAFCRSVYIDEDGRELGVQPQEQAQSGLLPDPVERLASEQRIMTPSIVVRRCAYEALGGFDRRLACAEDWEMWVRVASRYPVWYEPRALALYRMHARSNTGRHVRSARDAAYNRLAIELIRGHLPPDRQNEIVARARRTYAQSALDTAARLLDGGDGVGFLAQSREAFRLSPGLSTLKRVAGILLEEGRRRVGAR